ncbi:MAG: hypothetical protein HC895_04165 [Leptolyngbyaceae cyanobacterium SM1_3_5]|nr:hypothetical protein [Leptolyngbyaceae cyanobacterium SM1_3_5]
MAGAESTELASQRPAAGGDRAHLDTEIAASLQQQNITTFVTDEQGAIAWTPDRGFAALLKDESAGL